MPLIRHYLDRLALTLFEREAVYNHGPTAWGANYACSMLDFDDASGHETYDDTIVTDVDVVTGHELISVQENPRYSVRLAYQEPRCKPNTLAGLIGLALGNITMEEQDTGGSAFRHKITKGSSVLVPSISAMTKRDNSAQFAYLGVKSDGFTLSNNGPYLQFQSTMIGSGARGFAADTFPTAISEHWLRWGDTHLFFRDTEGVPWAGITGDPVQGASNLGVNFVDISTRVLTWSLNWTNSLAAEGGYRASTGTVRGDFHPTRRAGTITFTMEVDTPNEGNEISHYFNQTKLSIELNCDSGVPIFAGSTMTYGVDIILPRVQLSAIPRGQTNQMETLTFTGNILDDAINSELIGYVWNGISEYLVETP